MSNLPVFHDDQHGTSIASLAGLINSLRICDKQPNQCRVVIAGAGAAGINIAKIIHSYGIK
jgi:malic enzyme